MHVNLRHDPYLKLDRAGNLACRRNCLRRNDSRLQDTCRIRSAAGIASADILLPLLEQTSSRTLQTRSTYLAEDGRVDGVTDVLPQCCKRVQTRHLPSKTPGRISDTWRGQHAEQSTRSQVQLAEPGASGRVRCSTVVIRRGDIEGSSRGLA